MRLSRWHRIGVVLSVLWIFGSALYTRNSQVETATDSVSRIYQMCMDTEGAQSKNCTEQFNKNYEVFLKPRWAEVAISAFAPVVLGWLLVFIIIRVYRWINAGEV